MSEWLWTLIHPHGPVFHTLPLIVHLPLGFWTWGPA